MHLDSKKICDKNNCKLILLSVPSLKNWNYNLSDYHMDYNNSCESKKKPILLVSLCLLIANLIKWIGYSNVNVGVDFLAGLFSCLGFMTLLGK